MDFSFITEWLKVNLVWLILIGGAIYIISRILRYVEKKPKVVSRAMVERDRRIADISQNSDMLGETVYKDLYHGRKWLGKIMNIVREKDDTKPDLDFLEIVYKPKWFWLFLRHKPQIIRIFDGNIIKNPSGKAIIILPTVNIDNFFGLYYDMPFSEENRNFIKSHLYKNDQESLGDIYFAESQKRSTIDFDKAHDITEKEMELQIEREKRARAVTGG